RQLADTAGLVTLTQSYAPYGETVSSVGTGSSVYQFTGEMRDANGLTYLRARYYAPQDGRFISRDTWGGDYNRPLSLNRWNYTEGNPVNFTDASGHFTERAIATYLNKVYGNETGSDVLKNWKQDQNWWDMMRHARAGDVLFGGWAQDDFTNNINPQSGEPVLFAFRGRGTIALSGITMTDLSNHWTYFDWLSVTPSLEELRAGELPKGSFARRRYLGGQFAWAGFLRWNPSPFLGGTGNYPSFYVKNGLTLTSKTTPEWVRTGVNGLFEIMISAAVIASGGGGSFIAEEVAEGLLGTGVLDICDMQENDVQVLIGDAYFNFQGSFLGGFKLEHYEWNGHFPNRHYWRD
ncbi:MAG: RHS repeat-associated core domain-containing protein, partial [Methanosarcinaceae archaeon]